MLRIFCSLLIVFEVTVAAWAAPPDRRLQLPPTSPARRVTAPAGSRSRFGVVLRLDGDDAVAAARDLAAIHAAGIAWVRVVPDWRLLEPSDGNDDWGFTDAVVRAAHRADLSICYTLGFTPRWASPYAASTDDEVWSKNAPADLGKWSRYVRAVTLRYGSQVSAWQVWERPRIYWFRGTERQFIGLQGAAREVLRQISDAPLLLPEAGPVQVGSINRYVRMTTDFDVLGLDAFFRRPEDMIRPLDVVRADIFGRKTAPHPLWMSSLGWNVRSLDGPLRDPVVTPREQAAFLVRGSVLALARGVQRVFWYSWRDLDRGPTAMQSRAGLLDAEGRPRPAFGACVTLMRQLAERPFISEARWGSHLHGALFADAADGVVVAWSDAERARLEVPSTVRVLDMQGNERAEAMLGDEPVYLVGPRAPLEALLGTSMPSGRTEEDFSRAADVSVELGAHPHERGLHVGRYAQLTRDQVRLVKRDGCEAWSTRLADGHGDIYFDVDDSFMYFNDGRTGVDLRVEVHAADGGPPTGFNVGYDAVDGFKFGPWQWVEAGSGWRTYDFHFDDANFCDGNFDFEVHAFGSKADLCVRSVRVGRR